MMYVSEPLSMYLRGRQRKGSLDGGGGELRSRTSRWDDVYKRLLGTGWGMPLHSHLDGQLMLAWILNQVRQV